MSRFRPTVVRRRAIGLACLALAVGCAGEKAPQRPEVSVWRMDPDPLLQIGTADGPPETTFGSVSAVLRTRAGSLVVVDDKTPAIRMFDSLGRYMRSIGERGDGPGEYHRPTWVAESVDGELVVYDSYAEAVGRVLQYDTTGNVLDSETRWHSADASPGTPLRLLPDGAILFRGAVRSSYRRLASADTFRGLSGVVRWRQGDSSRTLLRVPGQLVTREPVALHDDGILAAGDSLIYSALPARYAIAVYGLDGVARDSILRPDIASLALDDEVKQRLIERSLRSLGSDASPDERTKLLARLDSLAWPALMPVLSDLLTDDAGRLWAARIDLSADGPSAATWSVYAPHGVHLADFERPQGRFAIMRIESDHLLGVWHDQDDLPYVRIHRIIRTPP